MPFSSRSHYVSHAGLPGALDDVEALDEYIFDINRELFALAKDWMDYSRMSPIRPEDNQAMQITVERLNSLRRQALAKRANCADEAPETAANATLNSQEKWHTREGGNIQIKTGR